MGRKLITYTGDFFLCMLLAPVGILKIAHRQMQNKKNLIRGGEKLLVASGIAMIIFVILIVDPEMLTNPFTYMYGSAGILGIVFGIVLILQGVKYNKYKSAITSHNLRKIREISGMIKLPEEKVIKDVLKMIEYEFFSELKYDSKAKTLCLNNEAMAQIESKTILCHSCGASVTIIRGERNRCEYCGSALNY